MPPANKPKHQSETDAVRVLELDPCKVLTKPMSESLALDGSSEVIADLAKYYRFPDELEELDGRLKNAPLSDYEMDRRLKLIRLVFAQACHWRLLAKALIEASGLKVEIPSNGQLAPEPLEKYRCGMRLVRAAAERNGFATKRRLSKQGAKISPTPARDRTSEKWNKGHRLIDAALAPDQPRSKKLDPTYNWSLDEHPINELQCALGLGRTQFFQLRRKCRLLKAQPKSAPIPFADAMKLLSHRLEAVSPQIAMEFASAMADNQTLAGLNDQRTTKLNRLLLPFGYTPPPAPGY